MKQISVDVGGTFTDCLVLDEGGVVDGLVSLEAARRIYCVVLDPQTLALADAKTARLRSQPAEAIAPTVNERTLDVELT